MLEKKDKWLKNSCNHSFPFFLLLLLHLQKKYRVITNAQSHQRLRFQRILAKDLRRALIRIAKEDTKKSGYTKVTGQHQSQRLYIF